MVPAALLAAAAIVGIPGAAGAQPRGGAGTARGRIAPVQTQRAAPLQPRQEAAPVDEQTALDQAARDGRRPPADEHNAREVRQRLEEILRDYPPSLGQVLRLDPSLLTPDDYLAPYPVLAAFIAQHPEIARDPAFYLGQPNPENSGEDTRARTVRVVGETMGMAFVLCGFIAFFALVGWLARLIADYRRWLRATKAQSDAHSKLLDRLTSNEELLAYIQTPAARHFLESAPIPLDAAPRAIAAPVGRILWSVQAGVVLAIVGVGLWLVKSNVLAELSGPLNLVAVLVISLGVGFALSAAVAYVLSDRLGLLEPPKP
jgi:hypothetical protein